MSAPRVSVLIPTRGRPALLPRAVRSALAQTVADLEVVVVVDGPDPATEEVLAGIDDPRLVSVALPASVGKPTALAAAMDFVRAPWVAFLDDDDEWLPGKLAAQLDVAATAGAPHPIVSCRFTVRSEEGETVWPLRLPEPGEEVPDYLFCQRGPWGGEGMLLPSTLLTSRALLEAVPFTAGLQRHEDVDWLLRAARHPGVTVRFVPDPAPLAVWNVDRRRPRMSDSSDWRQSLDLARRLRGLMSPHAYAAFLLIWAGGTAARGRAWRGFLPLLAEAFRHGRVRLRWLAAWCSLWFLTEGTRRRVAVALTGRRA